jgi:hypothetical protein
MQSTFLHSIQECIKTSLVSIDSSFFCLAEFRQKNWNEISSNFASLVARITFNPANCTVLNVFIMSGKARECVSTMKEARSLRVIHPFSFADFGVGGFFLLSLSPSYSLTLLADSAPQAPGKGKAFAGRRVGGTVRSKSRRAGLVFPAGRIDRLLRHIE